MAGPGERAVPANSAYEAEKTNSGTGERDEFENDAGWANCKVSGGVAF